MLDRIVEVIRTQGPRRIAVAFDDWPDLESELESEAGHTKDKRGRYRGKHGRFAAEPEREDCAYVLGVFVYRSPFLSSGEISAE